MDEATYLKERVEDQYNWYNNKSSWNQRRYKRLKTVVLVVSVSIPLLSGAMSEDWSWLKYIIGIGGVIIAISEGLLSLHKYHENWTTYRLTAESLYREKLRFTTKTGVYKNSDAPFDLFVDRIESLLADENQQWFENIKSEEA